MNSSKIYRRVWVARLMFSGILLLALLLPLVTVQGNTTEASEIEDIKSNSNHEKEYFEGELIVEFEPSASPVSVQSTHFQLEAEIKNEAPSSESRQLVQLPEEVPVEEALKKYQRAPGVQNVSPHYRIELHETEYQGDYTLDNWGLERINAPGAWNINAGSKDVVVAVIDTGVDYRHPDLQNNMWSNEEGSPGADFVDRKENGNPSSDPMDKCGHGTHVAGTIAGINEVSITGVMQNTQIMALRGMKSSGGSSFNLIEAIYYAVDHGADIINNSWSYAPEEREPCQLMKKALEYAKEEGVLVVCSAGNTGSDNLPSYPANYDLDNVISVAAVDENDELAGFSNYDDHQQTVHLAAPGVNIVGAQAGGDGHRRMHGTSAAAPHVSGTAGLIKSQDPELDYTAIKDGILGKAEPVDALTEKTQAGGIINAQESVAEFLNTADRIAGTNRYQTSAKVALEAYESASTVILSRGDDAGEFADGLAAGVLSGALDSPILLTEPGQLPETTREAIEELAPREAYILGGKGAVGAEVEQELENMDLEIVRLAGNSREETAALVAKEAQKEEKIGNYALVVNGFAPADALVAGPAAFNDQAPILQVTSEEVPRVTKEVIQELNLDKLYVVGGTSVVSKKTEAELADLAPVKRLAGKDRFSTSVKINQELFPNQQDYALVSGHSYADAIGASVYEKGVLYVRNNNPLPPAVEDYLEASLADESQVTIFGGTAAVSKCVNQAIQDYLN